MILRAFYSSPFRAYPGTQRQAIEQAMLGLLRIRHSFQIALAMDDLMTRTVHSVWSPLLEGDIIRAERERHGPRPWSDADAEAWCLEMLGRCNCLIKADSIPRRPGARSFCDAEESFARQHGLRIIPATQIEHGLCDLQGR